MSGAIVGDRNAIAASVAPSRSGHAVAEYGTPEMVLSHRTERSILDAPNLGDFAPFAVGDRRRYATCSDIAWFPGPYLAVVNLYGQHLRIYRFDHHGGPGRAPARLQLLHEITEGVPAPEGVSVSPDGKLLAIGHSLTEEIGVSLYPIDPDSLRPGARELVCRGSANGAFHGVTFTPDGRHIAVTEIGHPGFVAVMRTASGERTCILENKYAPFRPKSIAFSPDGRFAVIVRGLNVSLTAAALMPGGMISIHPFDMASGVIGSEALAELQGQSTSFVYVDMCSILPRASGVPCRILVVDQGIDQIVAFDFDPENRTLAFAGHLLAGLSFPHGVAASADGRFVAVTTYGDDSLHIFDMRRGGEVLESPLA
jgi:6-phosphogluconolactonase (cycloisomerase 2 family)